MAINVISDAPHVPRSILRTDAESVQQPHTVVTTEVTTENWDLIHWKKFRYAIVDALAPFPDALAAFVAVVESFRAGALNNNVPVPANGGPT